MTVYLSEMLLNVDTDLTTQLVDDRHKVHMLLRAVVQKPKPHPLWRLDCGSRPRLVIQSCEPVHDWLLENYPEAFGWVRHKAITFDVDKKSYVFQLEAVPTVKKAGEKNRQPILDQAGRVTWLHNKLGEVGTLEIKSLRPCPVVKFERPRKRLKGVKRDVTLTPVRYAGTIDVQQPDLLISLLENGVGSAKAFGCGLLNVT